MRSTPLSLTCAALPICVCSLLCAQPQAPPPKPVTSEKQWEAKFAGHTPEEQLAILDQLAREWLARRGAVEVAHQRFQAQADELQKLRTRLDGVKQPGVKGVPVVLGAKDVDDAITAAQQRAEDHAARAEQFSALITSAGTLLKRGAEFEVTARALSLQSDAMQAARKFATEVPPEQLPAEFAPKSTADADNRLKILTAEVAEVRDRARSDLKGWESALKIAKMAAVAATAERVELKAARAGLVATLAFEEQVKEMQPELLADEFTRFRALTAEKVGAISGAAAESATAIAQADEARAKLAAVQEPSVPLVPKAGGSVLDFATRQLFVAQQYLAARLRAAEERAERTAALIAALDELERKAAAYLATLDAARQGTRQLGVVASEIARRVARGELEVAKVPEGVAEAAVAEPDAQREADAKAVRAVLAKIPPEREALRKPDPAATDIRVMTATLLAHVTARIDRLTDFQKLAAEYATARKDRSETEQKRLDQRAAERLTRESERWDMFLGLDQSRHAAEIAGLLEAYYKELVEREEKQDSLQRQRAALEQAVESTRTEAADIAKLRAMLDARAAQSESARKWDEWLAARLAPTGLKAEAETYRDEIARLNASSGANARRVQALTGNEAAEASKTAEQAKLPATGGAIGQARRELFEARARGWAITGIKIGLILLGALILPRLIIFVLRQAIRGGSDDAGNPSPVFAPLRGALKLGAWIAALALILSLFGFDVAALVIVLAIGVLVVGLAARPVIADVLGAVVIVAERQFKVGDVVRLGDGEPTRVVDLTWRSTALKNASGLVVSVPNRTVTEATVVNLSRGAETYDSLTVTISTDKDAGKVIGVLRAAIAQCKNVVGDHGVSVVSYNHKGGVKVVEYRFWWFLRDFEARNKTRDEVFARVALGLAQEDMTGIEVTLA